MKNVPILIPLLNPNEPDGVLAAIHVSEGQRVAPGDLLFTLETTKATADVLAEGDGYLAGLGCQAGEAVRAGQVFAYLAERTDWQPPQRAAATSSPQNGAEVPAGLRISQAGLALARQYKLDLTQLPIGPLLTEGAIRARLEGASGAPETAITTPFDAAASFDAGAILIYGGGGHGKALIELLRALGTYRIAGIVDDGLEAGGQVMGVPVLGGAAQLGAIYAQGVRLAVNAVGGISNIQMRVKIFEQLAQAGFGCPALVHPRAWVEPSARLAAGVQVFPLAYVGSDVQVGAGAIVNTGVIVSHDCVLGNYVNLSPGAILAGMVKVGERALIGMGVTINLDVSVGAVARIGNGATVKADVAASAIVRAGTIFPG